MGSPIGSFPLLWIDWVKSVMESFHLGLFGGGVLFEIVYYELCECVHYV